MMYQPEIERIGEELYFVAGSPVTRRLRIQAGVLAQTDVPVLITGEAGSGKATVAELIHSLSLRSSFPFVNLNCGAMTAELLENELFGSEYIGAKGKPETSLGKLDQCARGTILLEDLDSMPNAVQERLLKLLVTREFVRCGGQTPVRADVRIMAAMEAEPDTALEEKTLNSELCHRLSLFHLHVSPLRERREEIPLLVGHFMIRLVQRYGVPAPRFTNVLIEACQRHAWPGNLRELENFVKRFLALGDEQAALEEIRIHQSLEVIERTMNGFGNGVEAKVTQGTGEKSSLKMVARNAKGEAERHAIAHALEETRWNRKAAARLLNISYRGLLYKIQEYHMSPPADDASSAREPILRQAT